jgi:hypothetical protein
MMLLTANALPTKGLQHVPAATLWKHTIMSGPEEGLDFTLSTFPMGGATVRRHNNLTTKLGADSQNRIVRAAHTLGALCFTVRTIHTLVA